jgi:hypothetical protein
VQYLVNSGIRDRFELAACQESYVRLQEIRKAAALARNGRRTYRTVDGPWPGKLALAARPRGGEWLHDELANWRREGVHSVFSRLTPEEEQDLDLTGEQRETRAYGMGFRKAFERCPGHPHT